MFNGTLRWLKVGALSGAVALIAGACGGGGGTDGGSDLSGAIAISGSSTVEPISAANAEKFSSLNPGVQISVDGPGTGDGFELFCKGETDISDASRMIKEEEIELCESNGVEFVELRVGIDGISVLTSPDERDALPECLSFHDLYSLLGPESEGFDSWSDANTLNREVGGSGDLPDEPLTVTAPGEESGTFDSFVEIVLEGIAVDERDISEDGPFARADYQASADDNVIIQGISGNEGSLGWVGFAFFDGSSDLVTAFPISEEENGDCVEPTAETIASGDYPIARDLFIYVNKAKAEANPALQAYIDFYLSDDGMTTVGEVGYVQLQPDAISETRGAWESKETGTSANG